MKKLLLAVAVSSISATFATPFTGNDAQSQAMGNTGVASAEPASATNYNPALLATYADDNDFSMTLPSLKLYIDDSEGFAQSAESFVDEGGTWDQFQELDSDALEAAVSNISPRLTDIATDITDLTAAIDDIESANNQSEFDAAVTDFNAASASLTTNSGLLDDDVSTVDVQVNSLDSVAKSASSDLSGLSDKAIQFGLGVDGLSVALPSRELGLALNLSNTTTIGASLSVSDDDIQPILDLSGDLTGYTAEATVLTSAVNTLAAANEDLADHFSAAPAFTDPGYAAWEAELTNKEQAVIDAQTDVTTAEANLSGYDGDNGTIVDGEIVATANDELTSEIQIVGANIAQVGVSAARQLEINGQVFSAGITTKLQSITVFEKTISFEEAGDEANTASDDPVSYFNDNQTNFFLPNFDLGASKTWDYHGQIRAGVVIKDLIPWTLETDQGTELKIRPKVRIGGAHETQFTTVSADLDITENQPLKYGAPTRYLGIGGEVRAWQHAAFRLGYRANLSVEDSGVLTTGLGLTPFGVGLDLSVWGKPNSLDEPTTVIKDIGFVLQLSANF